MKKYNKPLFEITVFEVKDIITSSASEELEPINAIDGKTADSLGETTFDSFS